MSLLHIEVIRTRRLRPRLPAAEHAPEEHLHINTCQGRRMKVEIVARTNDTTAATLSDHLLRSMLIAQERAASVDGHQTVKVVNARYAPLRGWSLAQFP